MKRKTSGVPTRVYKYGLPLGPTDQCREAVEEQIWLAHRYKNDLIRLALDGREAYRELAASLPEVAELNARVATTEAELKLLVDGVQSAKADARASVAPTLESRREIKRLRAELKKLRAETKAITKKTLKGSPDLDALQEEQGQKKKALRADCGCYWGTYLLVEKDVELANGHSTDPRFKRFEGGGRLGVQLQKGIGERRSLPGLSVAGALSGRDKRLRIRPVPDEAWKAPRGDRKRMTRTEVSIRIGSNGREPMWATFPMIMHRPLPADGVIKWAWVQCKRIGGRKRWEVCFVVEHYPEQHSPSQARETVAVDLGFKGAQGDHRVALAVGTDGKAHHLPMPSVVRRKKERDASDKLRRTAKVPTSVLGLLEHADSLRSIADREFNEAREDLLAWVRADRDAVPEWMLEELRYAHAWRSPRKLARLVGRWGRERFADDESAFAAAEAWRRQNAHLYQWECDERSRAAAMRKEAYRVWAADLARTYGRVVLERVDFAQLRRRAAPEDAPSHFANRMAGAAAPGELRDALLAAFGGAKSDRVALLSPNGRATKCPACSGTANRDGYALHCIAPGCGEVFDDADYARCMQLLQDAGADTSALTAQRAAGAAMARALREMERRTA